MEQGVPVKEFFTFRNSEGIELNGYLLRPGDFDPAKKYPVLMTQYSGPGSQQVADRWTMDWTDVLAQQGYIVACVDGRGTGFRGESFRKCTYRQLGRYETEDQIEAARYLGSLPYVDGSRIGIYGWSYGGFMALNCILKGNDVFRIAIAVAPVTSWRFYDTVYTEIYNGMPQDNPSGYDDNSPIRFADRLEGKLLIAHGTADDNVHIQNTYEMAAQLTAHGKPFEMRIYPDKNHSMGNARHHLLERCIEFVKKICKKRPGRLAMRQKLVTLQEDNLTPAKHENKCSRCRIDRSGCLCLSFSPRITDSPAAEKTASSSVSAKTDSLQRKSAVSKTRCVRWKKNWAGPCSKKPPKSLTARGSSPGLFAGRLSFRHRILQPENRLLQGLSPAFDDAEEQLRQVLMQDSAYLSLMRHLPEKDGKPDYERLKAGQELIFTRLSHTSEEYRWKREIRERRLLESNTALLRTVAAVCRRQNREVPPFPVPHLQNKIQKDAEAIGSDLATYLSPDKEMEMKYSDELRQAIASLEEAREALWLTRQDLYRLQDERK
ncbi:MAG: alpha/beta hydrolase family protein [Alistipes sp.]